MRWHRPARTERQFRGRVAGERLLEGEEKKRLEDLIAERALGRNGSAWVARRPRGHSRAHRRPGDRARGGRANHPRFRGRGSAHRGPLRVLRRRGMSPPRLPGRGRPAPAPGRRLARALPRGDRARLYAGVLRHRLPGGQTRPAPYQPPRGRALVGRRDRRTPARGGDGAPFRGLPGLLPQRGRAFRALDRACVRDGGPGRGPARPA